MEPLFYIDLLQYTLDGTFTGVLYAVIAATSWLAMFVSLTRGVPLLALWPYLPFFLISLGQVILILKGK